ncbi:MAG: Ppx/GppA phosphatase family protein, partial [Proteobacteria bacterium]|nr:Ppx/GppA phosphatase family protein [Pseudomonadota bacterium]
MYIRSSAEHAGAIAAIDIGSNSIHMVVARVDKSGHLDVLDADKVGVRLGNYILANGNLSSEGEIKALKIVRHMAEIAKAYKASVRAVATHALREAKNHSEVIERIFKKCGVKIDIIDGVEEARLVFLGMRYALPIEHQLCLGMDIGGGSTEFIIGKGDDIHFATSLKIGAVTLTRSCFGSSPPTSKQLRLLHDQIRLRVDPLVPQISREHFKKAIASSGTAKAIAAVHCRLFKRRLLKDENGYRIPVFELNAIIKALEELKSAKNIRTTFGVDASRAEILLAGAAVMKEASRAFQIKEWIITTFGLREGVVIDTYRRMGNERLGEASDIRGDQVTMLGRDWRIDEIYAGQVARLTLSIFDQLAPILYPKKVDGTLEGKWLGDRDLLRVAAWLHECGKFISTSSYHKHGYYLVNNSRLSGFT